VAEIRNKEIGFVLPKLFNLLPRLAANNVGADPLFMPVLVKGPNRQERAFQAHSLVGLEIEPSTDRMNFLTVVKNNGSLSLELW